MKNKTHNRVEEIKENVEKDIGNAREISSNKLRASYISAASFSLMAYLIHISEGYSSQTITDEVVTRIFEEPLHHDLGKSLDTGKYIDLLANTKKCGPIIEEMYANKQDFELEQIWEYRQKLEMEAAKIRGLEDYKPGIVIRGVK